MKRKFNRKTLLPIMVSLFSLSAFIYIYTHKHSFSVSDVIVLVIMLVIALNALLFMLYKHLATRVEGLEMRFLTIISLFLAVFLILIAVAIVFVLISI